MPDASAPDLLVPTSSTWGVTESALADVLADADSDDVVLALPVPEDGLASNGPTAEALELVGLDAHSVAATYEPSSEAGSTTQIPLPPGDRGARTVVLVGIGDGGPEAMRSAGAALGRAGRGRAQLVAIVGSGSSTAAQGALVEGVALGG